MRGRGRPTMVQTPHRERIRVWRLLDWNSGARCSCSIIILEKRAVWSRGMRNIFRRNAETIRATRGLRTCECFIENKLVLSISTSISEIRARIDGCASSAESLCLVCRGLALQSMDTLKCKYGSKIFRKVKQTADSARTSRWVRSGQIQSQSSVGRWTYRIH